MSRFNVGDYVILIEDIGLPYSFNLGDVFMVEKIHTDSLIAKRIIASNKKNNEDRFLFLDKRFKKLNKKETELAKILYE